MTPATGQEEARRIVTEAQLGEALDRARELAVGGTETRRRRAPAVPRGSSPTLWRPPPTLPAAPRRTMTTLTTAISAGGDTDSIGATLGGWLGARHGEPGLPVDLIAALTSGRSPSPREPWPRAWPASINRKPPGPRPSATAALARNLALYPVVLGHGFRPVAVLMPPRPGRSTIPSRFRWGRTPPDRSQMTFPRLSINRVINMAGR